ncbi:MAG: hypothetical protein CM1200mP9_04830 [Gammaproteobacteria bacterium]|nr:MAG: hypothetical protein CM1200mP9_04830 [Gammaproteobacteria bacterium]
MPEELGDIEALGTTRFTVAALCALITLDPSIQAPHFLLFLPTLRISRHIKSFVHLPPIQHARNVNVFGTR